MSFRSIVSDIKKLKVQGAQNVAKASLRALILVAKASNKKPKDKFLKDIENAKKILFDTRPTEPLMRNVLNYATNGIIDEKNTYSAMVERQKFLEKRFKDTESKIEIYGSKKIFHNSVVFTHCHSSSVMRIIKMAHHMKKNIHVLNTETRPLFQGRKTATELAKLGIPVTHFVDSAARLALKKADIMLIGADAISSEGKVVNKIGSELFAEIAYKYDVPIYVCSDSWKFDPLSVHGYEELIEERDPKEVWNKAPKGINISNLAFERVKPDLVTGIISELGIFKPEIFVQEVKARYPFLF